MFNKITRLVLSLLIISALSSCGKPEKTQEQDRLTYSFRNESPELQQHVAVIVEEAKALKYQDAMNKLALLSATRNLTSKQKYAVETLSRQLRYDLEEKIFTEQGSTGVTDE